MEPIRSRKNIPKSDAIWIGGSAAGVENIDKYNQSKKSIKHRDSYDSGFFGGNSFSSISSSMSSPFDYKRSISSNSYVSGREYDDNLTPSYSRRRTMTVANDDHDDPFSASTFNNQSSTRPGNFRRSNSVSGAYEPNFGGIIKRSIGTLFNAATVNTSLATATIQKSVPKVKCLNQGRRNSQDKLNDHLTDHMVSYLCESAIR